MGTTWSQVFVRLSLLLALGLFLGSVFGHVWLFLCLTLSLILAWHLHNLYRLDNWLQKSKKLDPPEATGIWGEVFYQIYKLQKRNRKRKRKLASMLKQFQASTGAMPDAAIVLSSKNEIEWFNKAAVQLLGLKTAQDIGQIVSNLVRVPDFTDFLRAVTEHDMNPRGRSIKILSPTQPHIMLRIHLVPYGDNKRLMIARDITDLHRLEQIRQDFVANVSHELRTPLTVINGFVETLQDDLPDMDEHTQAQWQRPVDLMAQQTRRMQNIVSDLLVLSRLESQIPNDIRKPVDIKYLLDDLSDEAMALSGEAQHQFECEFADDLQMYGSPDELESAFANLVFNAVRYTAAGGCITLRWYSDESGAHFSVEDTGEGIAEQHIPRLTERFYRVDVGRSRQQGGTGLGLAIVKHVLHRHQAHLHIDSQLGKGSVFRCDFPLSAIVQDDAEVTELAEETASEL